MKLTVDCEFNQQILGSQGSGLDSKGALAQLLAIAKITRVDMPLEALICEQYGLQAAPDYPIAAIAAAADGVAVGDAYWLRADPVHLVLQRDCFSLGEPVPLMLEPAHAMSLVASLNQHFGQDGLMFYRGSSGALYLRANTTLEIKTTLAGVAAGKNIHPFLPQGATAAKWVAVLNEVQMLLHEHPVNMAREASGHVAVNSLWLSGGGDLSQSVVPHSDVNLMLSDSVFYQGLAARTGVSCLALPTNFNGALQNVSQHVRLQLQVNNLNDTELEKTWFKPLLSALRNKRIHQLILNLGFYEKSLIVAIKPLDLYKFWRKTKPVTHYLI